MIFKLNHIFEEKFIVSESIYIGFINTFKDNNHLHVNDVEALKKGFKSKVMHGNILNGFLSYFVGECLPTKDVIIHPQEIYFKNPIYLDDELFFLAQVVGIFDSVNAVEFKFNFKNKESKILAKGKIQIGLT